MRRALFVLALISPTSPALADILVLSDGQQIRGVVTEDGEAVTVRLDFGSVSFAKSEVAEVKREATPIHELEEKRARLDANDAAGRSSLARWAVQNGLSESARSLYREVLTIRPDDPTARRELGYRKHEGRWLTEEEYLVATGHVLYGGQWVTKEESDRLEREALERRERKITEERIQQLESQLTLQEQRIEELESRPEPTNDFFYGGWWLPHHPPFAYGAFLPFPPAAPPHRPQLPAPQAGLRGGLRSQHGSGSVTTAFRPRRP